jgi:transposase-like protein
VIGVSVDGERDILGLWAGDGGEGREVLAERLRGDQEPRRAGCLHRCLRGPEGPPEAIGTTWELATIQASIIHLIGSTSRFASREYWDEMSRDLRPVYTASSEAAARERY